MSRKTIETIATLSSAQEGMLYETLRAAEPGIHIEQSMYTLMGLLDVAAFERAWQWGVRQHAMLRTGFVWKEHSEPLQITLREVPIHVEYHDWRGVSAQEHRTWADAFLREERLRGFDLAHPPLMRLALLHLEEQTYCFVWTTHHILMDGWSQQILLREVIACYSALSNGEPFRAKASRPYSDYIAWLKQQEVGKAEQFWRKNLQGFRQPTPLGREVKEARFNDPSQRYGTQVLHLPETIARAASLVTQQQHVTLSTLIQGVWAILLSRYSGSQDVVFGITVSGRPAELAGVETMVGLCINTLPLRVQVPAEVSLWDWLGELQQSMVEMHAYEYSPAGQVHQWSEVPATSLLYESLLVVENYPTDASSEQAVASSQAEEPGVLVVDMVAEGAQTKYALTFLVSGGASLGIQCIYDATRFERSAIEHILEHFQRILHAVTSEPEEALATLGSLIPLEQIPEMYLRITEEPMEGKYVQRGWDPVEDLVASVWCEVLGMQDVGREDSFFAQGGHSLLVTQLIARIRTVLGVEVPLRAMFEEPTVAGLARRIEQILRNGEAVTLPPLVVGERPEVLPLSFAQQRLWFLDQLEPGSPAYLIPNALRLNGTLDEHALEHALRALIERHESLRTTFEEREGQPRQVIHPAAHFLVPLMDLQGMGHEQAQVQAVRLATQEMQHPCDLVRGPLLRSTLLRVGQQEHVLLLTLHHIITDGWSNGVLLQELTTLYETMEAGEPSPLSPLPMQYADYALWQRAWLQGEVLEAQLAYWRTQLAGVQVLELPTDHPRPVVQSSRGATQSFHLSPIVSEQLVALSREAHVTLFMLLLAAFQVLLARYSGQRDISVGTPIANRRQAEVEGVIGFFVNTLVLRTDLAGDPTFQDVLERVREVCLGAYSHQDLPFEKVVEDLAPERNLNRNPLFQVQLIVQQATQGQADPTGVTIGPLGVEMSVSRFDLVLSLTETEQGLSGVLEYNTDLFEAETIERLLGNWHVLLEGIVQNPQAPVWQLPLLTHEEQNLLLVQWNTTGVASPQQFCVHELFEQQVQRTPETIALVGELQQLTYAQLNVRANQLAHYLQGMGVGPEVLVGICLPRSVEMIIGVLGILKAGGAYVPLDPTSPKERLDGLLQDAGLWLVLTQQQTVGQIPASSARVLLLDALWSELLLLPQGAPMSRGSVEHLAYLIYTSGSTGVPKGVQVTHRGVSILGQAQAKLFGVGAGSRVLQFAALTFDASVWELLMALLSGASLHLLQADQLLPGPDLVQVLREQAVSVVTLPPSVLAVLPQELLPDLQTLVVAGEACRVEVMMQWARGRHFYNAYGPTEATVCATVGECVPEPGIAPGSLSLGRPLGMTQVYVLDPALQLVPLGVVGEICLGGSGLARGYLKRAEQTAERFVPHPFTQQGGARVYRTGDRARYRVDGSLEYLGRVDQQVKLRGYRIELGEIEAVLREDVAVEEAVVLAREDRAGDRRLVGYVVLRTGEMRDEQDLRHRLQDQLPAYMLPSALVFLEAIPLTTTGKIDRRGLPTPEEAQQERDILEEARTPVEELVLGLWREILGYAQVGIHDNFFELGGHSLLVTQLVARVRTILGVEVSTRAVFESPTVEGFAQRVQEAFHQNEVLPLPPLVAGERPEVLPLSFAQQRLWFLEQLEPGSTAYLIPTALRIEGKLDGQALEHALEGLIERHESLRTTFEEREGQPRQVIHPAAHFRLPLIDLQEVGYEQAQEQAVRLATQEMQHPCDLVRGPLLRSTLLHLAEEEYVLLLTLRHIITDGWSNDLLVQELTQLYEAMKAGEPSPLAPLPMQYADYALWQRAWLQGEVLQAQLAYWRTQLAGVQVLELPTDHPRPAVQTSRGATQPFQLSPIVSEQLVALSRDAHVTLFMLLLAALQVLLARYSGQRDISVGTPIANRRQGEVAGVIGFFVNTLVLRTDLAGDPTFQEALQRVRGVCLGAYSHQDLPFEKVVEELAPQRDLSRSPLFQVMLTLQNMSPRQTEQTGLINPVDPTALSIGSLEVERTISRFDLSFSLAETEQGLSGEVTYNTDLFEAETITRLLTHWQMLLIALIEHPEQSIALLPLLPLEEYQILLQRNVLPNSSSSSWCLHDLLNHQVERSCEAIAIVSHEQQLTYRGLNRHANQLAHLLQQRGIGPEIPVGICLPPSLELIVAVLAVLKVGGMYLPLDPAQPRERLSLMVQDAHCPLVLTQTPLSAYLSLPERVCLCLDQQWSVLQKAPFTNLETLVQPTNAAYLLYTSGSTGTPKGVIVELRALLNYVLAASDRANLQAGVYAMLQPLAVDSCVTMLFPALLSGGVLQVFSKEEVLDASALAQSFASAPADYLKIAPSHLAALLSEDTGGDVLPRRTLIIGGEASSWDWSLQVRRRMAHGDLFNNYGPTETTVGCVMYQVEGMPNVPRADITPLGTPLAQTQIYILDEHYQVVPIGVVGELYIGGAGLARGYLGRPQSTAERFIPHPFTQEPGDRLYRTGDLVRLPANGILEFIGRKDDQVKIRGNRIELGEIEAALREHKGIREAVVRVQEASLTDKRLVAYLVAQDGEVPEQELLQFLQPILPGYMMPTIFVWLEALPLTAHGKLDRRALPAAPEQPIRHNWTVVGPHTPLEELVHMIWADLLHLPSSQVSIHDNFFALGGHSLLATQVIAHLRRSMQVEVPLRALFEYPTIATLAQQIETLRQRNMPPAIVPVARSQEVPLSFAQERLWFLDQLEPESTTYLIPRALRLEGVMDGQALERALEELIERHESLRTTFEERDGQPRQVIHPASHFLVPLIDLHELGQEQAQVQANRLATQEMQYPCNLMQGPLLRCMLLHLEEEEHVLLLTLHHIITDGWSNGVLVQELTTLYEAMKAGEPSPLAPLPIQYADYALWQRAWLQGEVLKAQVAYWRTQLAGVAVLELPTDHPRPAVQTSRGASLSFQLSPVVSEQLIALSQQEHVTLFMLLVAAFQVLLARYSGQRDISVGTPIANRRQAEVEGVIGFFVNTLVIRTDLSGDPTFQDVLQRVREVCLEAYSYQDLPFEKVVEELAPQRDLSRSPLFQVMLTLQNMSPGQMEQVDPVDSSELSIGSLQVESTISKFDLSLSLTETGRGFLGVLEYSTDLFEAETMERLLIHWQVLLQGVVHNRHTIVSELPLLPDSEREQVLRVWNTTQRAYPDEFCVHELFEQQVQRAPEAVALVCEDHRLTYGELNRRANRLAASLQDLGGGPEVLVGLCIERSPEMIIGLLGILKSGGGYVPLDPTYPKERLAFLVDDAHPTVIVTRERLLSTLPDQMCPIVLLDALDCIALTENRPSLERSPTSDNLAYMIYTSGSTGKPKGILTRHCSVVNYVVYAIERFGLHPGEQILQFASINFDTSAEEIYSSLSSGATLVLRTDAMLNSISTFLYTCKQWGITLLDLPTAYWHELVHRMKEERLTLPAEVHTVVIGSERALRERVHAWQHMIGTSVRLFNTYGPTETTIAATVADLTNQENEISDEVSIGKPIANTQVYVLDSSLYPVPIGVPGEMYIGGVGLARGYSQQPDLTVQQFIAHPFTTEPGTYLYKTGDFARYRRDGEIEFLSRMDQQVKVRGYRIELGEIEVALHRHAGIQDAVVLLREERPGEKQLVAYVVRQSGESLVRGEVRTYLQDRLPAYMVPAQVVFVEVLPLMPNGKIDRNALPASMEIENGEWQQKARTPVEEVLLGLWQEVLDRQQIGIHENFFELGGHSLLVTQLVARVRAVLGIEMLLRAVFEVPTVAGLAQRIEQAMRQDEAIPMPPLVARERPEVLPLSFAQQRLWFLDQLEPGSTAYLLSNAFRIGGEIDGYALERAFETLIERHENLRTTFEERSGQPIQVIHPVVSYTLPVICLTGLEQEQQEQEIGRLISQDAHSPFDLMEGPLVRMYLLRREIHEHLLLLTQHHIIADGWSNNVLLSEVSSLYEAFEARQPSPLAPLSIQYADYALWQRGWLQGEVLQRYIEYWKKQLWRVQPLKLPVDAPYTAIQSNRSSSYFFRLPMKLSQQLVSLSRQEGVTLFMLLLAAFDVLLYRVTDQTDIVVGTDVANRTHIETERLIGFFVNLLVLRTDMRGAPSFRSIVRQVRTLTLDAYVHQELPFDVVVEHLKLERKNRQVPLVQVLFVLQNLPGEEKEESAGGAFEPIQKSGTAKFDLAFFLQEGLQGISGNIVYREEIFQEQTIAILVQRFEMILRSVVAVPDTSIDELEISTDEEKAEKRRQEEKLHLIGRKSLRSKKSKAIDVSQLHSLLIQPEKEQ